MTRLLPALAAGLLISLLLFWLMQAMIMSEQKNFESGEKLQMAEFIRLKRETQVQHKDRKIPEEPPLKKRPPPPQPTAQSQTVQSDVPSIDMPNLDIPLQTGRFGGSLIDGVQVGLGGVSSNVVPLVRIPPRYPMRASARRIEGWVKLEFTITETGTVKDAVVVAAEPENIFDDAALKAIMKWKFKPKVIDNEAFEQRATQVIEFRLSR
ncbi:MAG: energy transducer TonB [Gammaproteobacteria bacterium]